jgi:spore coat-associated protein N
MSRLTPFLMVLALIVGTVGWQSTTPPEGAQATIKAVDGTLSLGNNLQGAAVMRAQNLAPGETVGGAVVLTNTGSLPGELELSQSELTDVLGPVGGQLSQAVQLTVRDVVSNAVVYQGEMSSLGTTDLGAMAPGETRTYSFSVLLPDTGIPVSATTGDNALAGAGVSVRYRWMLSGDDDGGGGTGGGSGTTVSRMRVKINVNAKKALKRGRVNVAVRSQEPCRIRAYAQLRKRRKMKTRRKSAVTRVANKRAVIKLKLPKKVRKNLKKRIAKKRKDFIVVYVRATDPRGGVVNLKKTVRVKAPKRKRG